MNDESVKPSLYPDYVTDYSTAADIARRSQSLLTNFFSRHAQEMQAQSIDPNNMADAFMALTTQLMANPNRLMLAQASFWQDYVSLWQSSAARMMGQESEAVVEPSAQDNRFRDEAWRDNPTFDFIKQSYLLTSNWVENLVSDVDGLSPRDAHKVEFFTRQYLEAMSPTNFAATNPAVLRETVETKGESLLRGLQNLLEDFETGDGKLKIKMADEDAFEVGVNVATTPGKVVFRNDLMELIQFSPTTKKVYERPVLITPPWINKYYILDMREKNSYIKWLVDQGHTVFIISWVNPDAGLAHKTFNDYMVEGPLAALDAIVEATGERCVNMVGYCIGGTLLSCTLAYLAACDDEHWKDRISSATFLTTLIEFSDVGDVSIFIDEDQVAALEETMNERGYLDGSEMGATFSMLRSSDLVWSFVINNYLMGKEPFPFDLLYWNNDSTRMPAAMHSYYLRKMYLENRLVEPGGIDLSGVAIDLTKIQVPAYLASARDDHIAPWKTTYKATQLYSGDIRFVLSSSGHIAGVVNPPAANKYCHWVNTDLSPDPDVWLDGAEQHEGSWWTDWKKWVARYGGKKIVARVPGSGNLPALENAPGTYVRTKT